MASLLLLVALAQVAPLPAGRLVPLYGLLPGQASLPVAAFALDVRPVTRAAFARFLEANPGWRHPAPALADERYLRSFGLDPPELPVVEVSYFAARAYCAWRGGRLPTTLEWEYAAAADETRPDAARTPAFAQRLLDWYARANDLTAPGSPRNLYGVEALHGLVWEWTEDFNAFAVKADERDPGRPFQCGGGAEGSATREDYAAFMRYALRASLSPRSCLPTLGLRCAYSAAGAGR